MDCQIPAMRQRGFTIGTTAGQLSIPPSWLADRLADHLTRALQCELLHQERRRHYAPQPATATDLDDSHGY